FPDKSKMKRAFTYEWRLWTLPELQELLKEAGFSKVTVYWQGWDEDDEPDGDFQPATEADADPGWVCFLSAEK
ncbi:MAG: class I SAM-dependent methyltransferase, partial [Gammaproteobacteria bacterium]|nr:class I SAM-dependent methyltransferase [Gammaproteobacteria bacterium]